MFSAFFEASEADMAALLAAAHSRNENAILIFLSFVEYYFYPLGTIRNFFLLSFPIQQLCLALHHTMGHGLFLAVSSNRDMTTI